MHNKTVMCVTFSKEAVSAGQNDKLNRFVRLHLGDGNEQVGAREIDRALGASTD
jgi:hypothetical protein